VLRTSNSAARQRGRERSPSSKSPATPPPRQLVVLFGRHERYAGACGALLDEPRYTDMSCGAPVDTDRGGTERRLTLLGWSHGLPRIDALRVVLQAPPGVSGAQQRTQCRLGARRTQPPEVARDLAGQVPWPLSTQRTRRVRSVVERRGYSRVAAACIGPWRIQAGQRWHRLLRGRSESSSASLTERVLRDSRGRRERPAVLRPAGSLSVTAATSLGA
jgi:hypothetical protein